MLHRMITGLAVAVLGLAVPLVAEAGPPHRTLEPDIPSLSADCFAAVTWGPLQGGKPMFVRVTLKYANGNGYSTVLQPGADQFYKVKQNAGLLEIDFSSQAEAQPASGYRVEAYFVDGKDVSMSGLLTADSTCSGTPQ
jgi:hypothetical protein